VAGKPGNMSLTALSQSAALTLEADFRPLVRYGLSTSPGDIKSSMIYILTMYSI